jgi:ABC-type transport system substrate-binding protein/tetratricopeptide (TPR) repeat protein
MAIPSLPAGRLPGRILAGLLVLSLALGATTWLTADLAAQGQKKDEKEDPGKPGGKRGQRPKEEEEEPRSKPRKVIKVDDEDNPPPTKQRPKPALPPPVEAQTGIADALRETKNPELLKLYNGVKVAHDKVLVRGFAEPITRAVEPLPRYYVGEQTHFTNGYIQAWTLDANWVRAKSATRFESALEIKPYEQIAIDEADAFLKKDLDQLPPNDPKALSRADMLKAAETVLATADRFHDSARTSGVRQGPEWEPLAKRLHDRLYQVQLERLDSFAKSGDWDRASGYARSLAEAYREPKEQAPMARRLVEMIQEALRQNSAEDQVREARQRLRFLEEIFPGSEALRPIAQSMRRQAQSLLDEAKNLRKAGNFQRAAERMQLALDIYPNLPGLTGELAQLQRDHPILKVGVRDRPVTMVPGLAATDTELRAIELLYESLVKMHVEPGVGQRYEPALAGLSPRLIPLGREFRIARGAYWSDGTPVTTGDVKETLRLMQTEKWPGYSPMWAKLIDQAESGGDSFRFSLRLSQGYLDPLSLMTFKVMPQAAIQAGLRPDTPPPSSGPFQFVRNITVAQNRKADLFLFHPSYEKDREGRLGLPRIKEIHLIHFADAKDDPAKALQDGIIDLALDLSAKQAAELRSKSGIEVRGPMLTRRVYFLAINHRRSNLKGIDPVGTDGRGYFVRRALALAIDRQAILDKDFREAKGAKVHHSLNGPFPAGSWPCADEKHVLPELYNSDQAKADARKAVELANGPITLTLLYPSGDPATKAALEDLRDGVNKELRIDEKTYIELKLKELEPHQLRESVERTHDYELAYYHYDHPSEAYWLAPLFDMDATEGWGSNYLGYLDSELQLLFKQAKNHRDFGDVKQFMNLAHQMLVQRMPLIPLWQLDTFIAHRSDVKPTIVDPILIFNDVEHWTLDRTR